MKRRILFVDDEPMILQGLRRMLRGMRGEWHMVFVGSGDAAMEALGEQDFDVVVTDMRMPGMDGESLLRRVKERHPNVTRIVLSGHSEKEVIMKSVKAAHQYLSKPCDADTLKSTIGRACALRDLLKKDALRRLVGRMESIPSLPSLYANIMKILESPNASVGDVGRIISNDLGMTAKVLQMVNSTFFGIRRHIANPSQAVTFLGLDTVKALVLTVGVFSSFDPERVPCFDVDRLWKHSITVGALSRELAAAAGLERTRVDNAFLAGLLHDVGKLVLAVNVPDRYIRAVCPREAPDTALWEREEKIFGSTHAEVGAYLMGLWGLPNSIVEAIAFHHFPSRCPAAAVGVLTAVHAANILEQADRPDRDGAAIPSGIDEVYLARLGLNEAFPKWREIALRVKGKEGRDG